MSTQNPKLHPDPTFNAEKDPDIGVSGDNSVTGAQASQLTTLSGEGRDFTPDG